MKYTSFNISNFKGIRELILDLDRLGEARIHTLVGLNESGKTTLLEAIDYFTAGSQDPSADDLVGRIRPDENSIVPISKRSIFSDKVSIQADIELDGDDVKSLRRRLLRDHKLRLSSIDPSISVRDEYTFKDSVYESRVAIWSFSAYGTTGRQIKPRAITYGAMREVWQTIVDHLGARIPSIWYFPNFLFEFPERVVLEASVSEPARGRFYRELIGDILNSLGHEESSVETHIVDRARSDRPADQSALQQLLLDMGRKITTEIFGSWDAIFKRRIEKSVRLSVDTDADGLVGMRFQIEDPDGLSDISDRSLGFRWFFIFLLLTRYRAFRAQSVSPPVFLIDEPASNLHATAQSQLLESLERLAEQCVVIYTTHSHYLINPQWLETTHIVQNKGLTGDDVSGDYSARQTNIIATKYRQFAATHPEQSYYYQPILDVLEYVPSRLDLVPNIVMVEGKTDFYAFRYMHDIVLERDELNFLPGGGSGGLGDLIRLYLAWARDFLVVLDSDAEGEVQRARYISELGPIVEDRIVLLSDLCEVEHGSRLEGMFENEDLVGIQQAVMRSGSYDKRQFSLAVQEALVTKKNIELSQECTERFAALFDSCMTKLI